MLPFTTSLFRPAVIIYVADIGDGVQPSPSPQPTGAGTTVAASERTIYDYFSKLCSMLEPEMGKCIAHIRIDEESSDATELAFAGTGKVGTVRPFQELFSDVLRRIQDDRFVHDLKALGYHVLIYPQIYIVGRSHSSWLSQVAEWVNSELGSDRAFSFVAYMLLDNQGRNTLATNTSTSSGVPPSLPADASSTSAPVTAAEPWPRIQPFWIYNLRSDNGALPLVNFCNIYTERTQERTFVREDTQRYALAEALFGMIVSGITATSSFRESVGNLSFRTHIDNCMGSFATSLLLFPREAIECYCSNMYAHDSTLAWVNATSKKTQKKSDIDELGLRARSHGEKDGQRVIEYLSDNAPRPGFEETRWPGLGLLPQTTLIRQLADAMRVIFQGFVYQHNWKNIRRQREAQATHALRIWRNHLHSVWTEVENELGRRIENRIYELLRQDDSGYIALHYTERLEQMLEIASDTFSNWSVQRAEFYKEELANLERLSNGPWVLPANASNLVDNQTGPVRQQLTLSATGIIADVEDAKSNVPPGLQNASDTNSPTEDTTHQTSPDGLSKRERRIEDNLLSRVKTMHNRIPDIGNLVAACCMLIPVLEFQVVLAIFPSWMQHPVNLVLLLIFLVGILGGVAWFLRHRAQRNALQAEQDLMRLYKLHFARRCAEWEGQSRGIVRGKLNGKVKRIHRRLENIGGFTEEIVKHFLSEAEKCEQELLQGPGAFRDVYVAGGQILNRPNSSLAPVLERLRRLIETQPQEPWHQDIEQVSTRMRESILKQDKSFLDPQDENQFMKDIQAFCLDLIRPYLHSDSTNISSALYTGTNSKAVALEELMKNARLLYKPQNNQSHVVYICGTEENCRLIAPQVLSGVTPQYTRHADWLLYAHFVMSSPAQSWLNAEPELTPLENRLAQTPQWP